MESINRELNNTEKEHCKKVTMKILIEVIAFAICCTVGLIQDMLSLIDYLYNFNFSVCWYFEI